MVNNVPNPSPGPQNVWTKPIWDVPPHDKKMPPLVEFRLTKELVQQRVKDNVIIVTFGNYAFMDFILTWFKQLTDLGLANLLVGAHRHLRLILFHLAFCLDYCDALLEMHIRYFVVTYCKPTFHTS